MARKIEKTVYQFSELADEAKEHAKNEYMAAVGASWTDEWFDSLKAVVEHFGGTLEDWSIDWNDAITANVTISAPEMTAGEFRAKLDDCGSYNPETLKGNGDCKLTGYCGDENVIDGIRQSFYADPQPADDEDIDVESILMDGFYSWREAVAADVADQFSDDGFSEHCDANGYEFYENGELA